MMAIRDVPRTVIAAWLGVLLVVVAFCPESYRENRIVLCAGILLPWMVGFSSRLGSCEDYPPFVPLPSDEELEGDAHSRFTLGFYISCVLVVIGGVAALGEHFVSHM